MFSSQTRFTWLAWSVALTCLLFATEAALSEDAAPKLSGVITLNPEDNATASTTDTFPFEVSGFNLNDRVFLSIEKSALGLQAGGVLRIYGVRRLQDDDADITGVSTNGSSSQLMLDSRLGQDLVLRSVGPRITIDVEQCDNCSFQLDYRILAVGEISSDDFCGVPQGCNYSTSMGMLTFPYVPVRRPFTHCVTAHPNETVQFEVRPDAIGLFADDTLVVTVGAGARRYYYSSKQAPPQRVMLSGEKGERLCLEYNGNDTSSFFYVLFRKIVHKVVRVQNPEKDIQQDYERNTLVTWFFEGGTNNSLLHLVVRGARLDALQGEFVIIGSSAGSGDALQPLKGSPAAVLTSNVPPGTHLKFEVNGPGAYVMHFMGDRRGQSDKQEPSAAGSKSLYMEWSRTGPGAEGYALQPPKNEAEKSKSVWNKALLLCVDVGSIEESVWNATKKEIQRSFANAANDHVKRRANPPDQKIEPHQVRLPDVSVVQRNNSDGFRIRVLVSIVNREDPDVALLSSGELQAVFAIITNHLGHGRFTLSDGNSFSLTDRCKEAGDSVWWYVFAGLSLAVSTALFLLIWLWRSRYYHRGTRSSSEMCGKSKAETSATTLPVPDTYHTNPAYEPSDDESGGLEFRNLQHINDESERRVVVESQRHTEDHNGAREAENAYNDGESSSRRNLQAPREFSGSPILHQL